ncbi:hypothetical protein ACE2AJ_15490 [Aquihabitans daechungensis]|uniref:hypothetical protein n=1 Tax=Aquihabitans daechungensis TaxID=1052257 RepID=UPI003B9F9D34
MGRAAVLAVAASAALVSCLAPGTPPGWSSSTILAGQHAAQVDTPSGSPAPRAGWEASGSASRSYQLTLGPSARYVITAPVQPGDQLDWNKLPGFSDCGDIDLSVNGAMFGWRWRIDVSTPRLELVPYANAAGVHQYPSQPLVTLSEAELALQQPLRYEIEIDGAVYRFHISGTIGGRVIDEVAQLSRSCPTSPTTTGKWLSGFYFGGTSVSPSTIYAFMLES